MSVIVAAKSAFPKIRHTQQEIMRTLKKVWPEHAGVLDRLTESSGVGSRNLVMPLDQYSKLKGLSERNTIYIDQMLKSLHQAVLGLQEEVRFSFNDVAGIFSTTVTGIAVPSLDARLMNLLPIPRNVVRTPVFGLGCMGGVALINRANDFLKVYPDQLALVLAAEACTLTLQLDDSSMANFVAASLFGDGVAAVILAGDRHPLAKRGRLKILGGASSFYPNSERIMGWDMVDSGFKVVLSGNVPEIVEQYVGDDVGNFLSSHQTQIKSISNIISHPGGPKVLKSLSKVLEKDESLFKHSWESLREQGNMSSVSVLDVLTRSLKSDDLEKGLALSVAMGPAFNSELCLMEVL
jgi:alkylresorcinol/alkylpyrone synthase